MVEAAGLDKKRLRGGIERSASSTMPAVRGLEEMALR